MASFLDTVARWLVRLFRLGPRCHKCRGRIVYPEPAVLVPCFGGHIHFVHHRCLLSEAQRLLEDVESKPGPRA
jgi:hypothetical protein